MADKKEEKLFRDVFLPALGVLETIASKGKSPGTFAMGQESRLAQRESLRKQEEEAARQRALQERLFGLRERELEHKIGGVAGIEEQQRKAFREAQKRAVGIKDKEKQQEAFTQLQRDFPSLFAGSKVVAQRRKTQERQQDIDIKQEGKLRDEFTKRSGDYFKVRDSYERVESSAQDPSAAGDLAMIFNYMKILDPGSVVRESEFATAQNAAGVPDRIRNVYNRVLQGLKLGTNQRQDFLNRARRLAAGKFKDQQRVVNRYTGLAERKGLDPQNVVEPVTAIPEFRTGTKFGGTPEQPSTSPEVQELINRAKAGDVEAQQGLTQMGIKF